MKILAFVDTHGKSLDHIKKMSVDVDVIICAGDFTIFENDIAEILKQMNDMGKTLLLVHGNHESSATTLAACSNMKNIHFIHNLHYIIGDTVFFGYGGGGFGHIDPKFETASEQFIKNIKEIEKKDNKKYKIVLVTHAPPYGTTLDNLGYHVGSKSIRKFIENHQPQLLICGHLHECAGSQDNINKSLMVNPGPYGRIIDI